jgi:hypothetical protein
MQSTAYEAALEIKTSIDRVGDILEQIDVTLTKMHLVADDLAHAVRQWRFLAGVSQKSETPADSASQRNEVKNG